MSGDGGEGRAGAGGRDARRPPTSDAAAAELIPDPARFFGQLRAELEHMVDAEMADTGLRGRDCPWIAAYITRYEQRPLGEAVDVARRWLGGRVPEDERALRRAIVDRAREGLRAYRRTGRMPPLPPGMAAPSMQDILHMAASRGLTALPRVPSLLDGIFRWADSSGGRRSSPQALRGRLGPGRSLPPGERSQLEASFGQSLSHVRLHTDAHAAQAARDVGARAFTVGHDIGFAQGSWRPGSLETKAILAHEVAHALQHREGARAGSTTAAESDADQAALGAVLGAPGAASVRTRSGLALRRCSDGPPPAMREVEGSAPSTPDLEDQPNVGAERSTVPTHHGGNDFELRIDADGDQLTELRLRLHGIGEGDHAQHLTSLSMTLSSLTGEGEASHSLDVTGLTFNPGFGPVVRQLSDGRRPFDLELAVERGPHLRIAAPTVRDSDYVYAITFTHSLSPAAAPTPQTFELTLPRSQVFRQDILRPEGPAKRVADAWYLDARVGAFGDRFRFTFVPSAPLTVRLGIVPMSTQGEVLGGQSFDAFSPGGLHRPLVVQDDDPGLAIDLDGDGDADVIIYDRVSSSTGADPSRNRRHHFEVYWPGTRHDSPGRTGTVDIRGGRFETRAGRPSDLVASSAAVAASSAALQRGAATSADFLQGLSLQRSQLRERALRDGLVPADMVTALRELEAAMAAMVSASTPAQGETRAQATAREARLQAARRDARTKVSAFATALAPLARPFTELEGNVAGASRRNAVTGVDISASDSGLDSNVRPYSERLQGALLMSMDGAAFNIYNQMIAGFDIYVASLFDEGSGDRTSLDAMARMDAQIGALPDGARPVRAVFHFEGNLRQEGRVQDSPAYLFYWKDGNTWHIKNLTNPSNTREVSHHESNAGAYPPAAAFNKLDDRDIFPKGVLWWSIPGGPAGHVRCTEPWEIEDVLNYFGIALTIAGVGVLVIGSGGTAAPIVGGYLLAGAGLMSAAGGVASMIDRAQDGDWDATGWQLDMLQVASGLLSGSAALGRVTLAAGLVDDAAPAYLQAIGRMGSSANFIVLNAAATTGDVISLAITTDQNLEQLRAIQHNPSMSDEDKARMQMQILGGWALNAGLVGISVIGDVAQFRDGATVRIGEVEGRPTVLGPQAPDAPPPARPSDTADGADAPARPSPEPPRATPEARPDADGEARAPDVQTRPDEGAAAARPSEPPPARADEADPEAVEEPPATQDAPAASPDAAQQRAIDRANAHTGRMSSVGNAPDLINWRQHRDTFAQSSEASTPWGRDYLTYLDRKISELEGHIAGTRSQAPRPPLSSPADYWLHRALFNQGQRFSEYLDALRRHLPAGELDQQLRRVATQIARGSDPASVTLFKRLVREGLDDVLISHLGIRPTADAAEVARMNADLQRVLADMGPNDKGRLGERWRTMRAQAQGRTVAEQTSVDADDINAEQGTSMQGNRRLDSVEIEPGAQPVDADDLERLGYSDDLLDRIGDASVLPAEHVEVKTGGVHDLTQLEDHLALTRANNNRGAVLQTRSGQWVQIERTALELQRPGTVAADPALRTFLEGTFLTTDKARLIVFEGGQRIDIRGASGGVNILAEIQRLLGRSAE